MSDFREIEKLWNEFRQIPFPANLVETEKGVDLVNLDTFTAGYIDTFIDNKGSLDKKRKKLLENCRKDIHTEINYLEDEAKIYFEKLLNLYDKIIRLKN